MNVNTSIAKDVLEEYYVGQKISAQKIAKLLNLKPHQVYYLLEKNGNEIVKPKSFSVSLEKRRQDDKDNYSITVVLLNEY